LIRRVPNTRKNISGEGEESKKGGTHRASPFPRLSVGAALQKRVSKVQGVFGGEGCKGEGGKRCDIFLEDGIGSAVAKEKVRGGDQGT